VCRCSTTECRSSCARRGQAWLRGGADAGHSSPVLDRNLK
jgi:hypothetical protein